MIADRELDSLAAQSRRGDAQALALIYRRLAPALLAYLERIMGEHAEAEDILHDAFLRLFQGRGCYTARGRFREWLFTVATRLALDRRKHLERRGRLASSLAADLPPHAAVDPCEAAVRAEMFSRVESALADVPPAYAQAFHLRVREAFSYREMAAICGEPEGTLRSRVHHTLKRIRLSLVEGGDGVQLPRKREEDLR